MHQDHVRTLAFLKLPSYSLDFNDMTSDLLPLKSRTDF